ncbi:Growth hormone-regulated TBC protein 6 [Diplonema papillatum]|nr:Growth hormone-regulated TBC protein 6 [Diplonema papillatum]
MRGERGPRSDLDRHLELCRNKRGLRTVGTCPDEDAGFKVRLERFYYKHAPHNVSGVDALLDFFSGREDELFGRLVAAYGEEPDKAETITAAFPVPKPAQGPESAPLDTVRDSYGFLVDDTPQARLARAAPPEPRTSRLKYHRALLASPPPEFRDRSLLPLAPADLHLIALHGVPPALRKEAWRSFAGVGTEAFPGGASLEEFYRQCLVNSLSTKSESTTAIAKDINRTFPNCDRFDPGAEAYASLFKVLSAVSHSIEDGYCQGTNFMAGVLLLATGNDEVTSFALLRAITSSEAYNAGYYTALMTTLVLDQKVMATLVGASPVSAKLQELGVTLEDFTIRWLLCAFIDVVPFETLLHLWDLYLHEGVSFLFRLALVIFEDLEPRLMAADDFSTAITAVNDHLKNLTDPGPTFLKAVKHDFTHARLLSLRAELRAPSPPPIPQQQQSPDAEGAPASASSPQQSKKTMHLRVRNMFKKGMW